MLTPMNQLVQKMKSLDKGFTLIELLLAFSILVFCLCGLLLAYIQMFIFTDLSRDLTLATNAVQAKMEDIKKYVAIEPNAFDPTKPEYLVMRYNGEIFTLNGLEGRGHVTVCDNTCGYINCPCPAPISYSDLKSVRIIICFKSRGRVIGEDANLDGDLDIGEDTFISNSRLDSPVELVTLIAR